MSGDVHLTYISRQVGCTPGAVYTVGNPVHDAYMKRAKKSGKALSWRKNCISLWRDRAGFTQEQVAEILEPEGLIATHTSVSRIEGGKQVPKIDTLEAMARLYRTDVDSMINRPPPADVPPEEPPSYPKRPKR